ncbi:MAG TPA: hypothetical protein VGM19_05095 [Armatimonadota bacterium]
MVALLLAAFWAMQVIAALLIKWGSAVPGRWWWGFFIGNLFGAPSLLLAMKVYGLMKAHPNVVLALATGGSFLFAQLAMAYFFPSRFTVAQIAGLATVGVGMVLAAGGASAGGS